MSDSGASGSGDERRPGGSSAGAALIIEDDMLIAWNVREMLEDFGFSPVMVATTDHSAGLAANDENLALIVCDLDLGSISATGFDILARIDARERIPTIIYTGMDRPFVEDAIKGRRQRAIILGKPADAHQLKAAVAAARRAGPASLPAEPPAVRTALRS